MTETEEQQKQGQDSEEVWDQEDCEKRNISQTEQNIPEEQREILRRLQEIRDNHHRQYHTGIEFLKMKIRSETRKVNEAMTFIDRNCGHQWD